MLKHLHRLWWAIDDHVDYAIMMVRATVSDWIHGPYPETEADRRRAEVARLKQLAEEASRSGRMSDKAGEAAVKQRPAKPCGRGKHRPAGGRI